MKIDQKFRNGLRLFVQGQNAIVLKNNRLLFPYCFLLFCNLKIPKQGIKMQFFFLIGSWRLKKWVPSRQVTFKCPPRVRALRVVCQILFRYSKCFPLFCRQNDLVLSLPTRTINNSGLKVLFRKTNTAAIKSIVCRLIATKSKLSLFLSKLIKLINCTSRTSHMICFYQNLQEKYCKTIDSKRPSVRLFCFRSTIHEQKPKLKNHSIRQMSSPIEISCAVLN